MSYRIRYARLDGALSAVVSGKSTQAAAGCIARDIALRAARESAERVLVDLRWLDDKVGMRAVLGLPGLRVAVLDNDENDAYYDVFSKRADLKYFASLGAALRWLGADRRSGRGDRKVPTPAGVALRAPLEIFGG